jgi:hypothetical protein
MEDGPHLSKAISGSYYKANESYGVNNYLTRFSSLTNSLLVQDKCFSISHALLFCLNRKVS